MKLSGLIEKVSATDEEIIKGDALKFLKFLKLRY
jgi:hypothetical protein